MRGEREREEVEKEKNDVLAFIITSIPLTCFSTSLSSSTSAVLLFSTSISSAFAAATSGGKLECAPPEEAGFFFEEPIVFFNLLFFFFFGGSGVEGARAVPGLGGSESGGSGVGGRD